METIAPIIRNTTFLLSLTFIYSLLLPTLMRQSDVTRTVITGILFGLFSIVTMNDPIHLTGGGIIDARHVIVMVSTMLVGWQGGLISAVIASVYRLYLGNPGAMPGVGSIIAAYFIGVIYNRLTGKGVHFNWGIIIAGCLVPFTPLLAMLTMSNGMGWDDLPRVAAPLIITYPIATYLLTQLLSISHHRLELVDSVHQFEQRQDVTFESTPTLLMGIDVRGKILNLNPAMETFLARTRCEIVTNEAHIHSDVIPVPIRLPFLSMFTHSLKGETIRQLIDVPTPENEKIISLDTYFIPIKNTAGEVVMVFVQASNITHELELKQKQVELAYTRERNTVLEQLIADASHHLRTPLSVMNSSRYLIKRTLENIAIAPDIQTTLTRQFSKLESAEQNLNSIIDDLLHLMKVNHTTDTKFEITDLTTFVQPLTDNYVQVAENKDKHFVSHIPEKAILVKIVPTAFQHVLENLIENGLRYTNTGGQVTFSITVDDAQQMVIIRVQDTGIGIPEDAQAHIFERFYRASNATTHNKRGSGLGLAIVKETLDSHGGIISVESEVDVGTTFTMHLPLNKRVAPQIAKTADAPHLYDAPMLEQSSVNAL